MKVQNAHAYRAKVKNNDEMTIDVMKFINSLSMTPKK